MRKRRGRCAHVSAYVCEVYVSTGKESARNAGDLGSIPRLWRSRGEGKGYPLQYSGLENSMGPQSQTQLSNFHFHALKKLGTKSVKLLKLTYRHFGIEDFGDKARTRNKRWPWSWVTNRKQKWRLSDSRGWGKTLEAYNLCGCWKQYRPLLRVSIELVSQTEGKYR